MRKLYGRVKRRRPARVEAVGREAELQLGLLLAVAVALVKVAVVKLQRVARTKGQQLTCHVSWV